MQKRKKRIKKARLSLMQKAFEAAAIIIEPQNQAHLIASWTDARYAAYSIRSCLDELSSGINAISV